MTPTEFKQARESLGLSQDQLARVFRMGKNGKNKVRQWEQEYTQDNGKPNSPPPLACLALSWLVAGHRPPEWPENLHRS